VKVSCSSLIYTLFSYFGIYIKDHKEPVTLV